MPMIDRTNDEVAALLAKNDRIRAERLMPKSSELQHATAARGGLIYRRQDDARGDNADYEAGYPAFDGEYGSGGGAGHVGEFDPYTMQLLEALGDALGMVRIEIRCEREAVEAKLLERVRDLQATGKNLERELKTLTTSYESAQARIAELERQFTTLTETRIANLERNTKALIKALPSKTARISVLEAKVKTLSEANEGEPSARDLDSRIAYIEALMSTIFPISMRSRI